MGSVMSAAYAMGLKGDELALLRWQIREERKQKRESIARSTNRRRNKIAAASRKRNRKKH